MEYTKTMQEMLKKPRDVDTLEEALGIDKMLKKIDEYWEKSVTLLDAKQFLETKGGQLKEYSTINIDNHIDCKSNIQGYLYGFFCKLYDCDELKSFSDEKTRWFDLSGTQTVELYKKIFSMLAIEKGCEYVTNLQLTETEHTYRISGVGLVKKSADQKEEGFKMKTKIPEFGSIEETINDIHRA